MKRCCSGFVKIDNFLENGDKYMALVLENVTYTYKPKTPYAHDALRDVSLTINQGEFLAIIGATGSGKSTLVQHLNGLLKPTKGRVLLNGEDINAKKVGKRVRQKVGLVFQYPEHQLFEETVYKDVAFGPLNFGFSEEETDERVKYALKSAGLDLEQVKDRSPFDLSGGQMRRVAIAGVLAMKPEILILDEPTAGLDPQGQAAIMNRISSMHQEQGITIVFVSHSMENVAMLAQRVIVMHRSNLVMSGSPREIFAKGEELRNMGLDIPQVSQLMSGLIRAGKEVRGDVLSIAEARSELLKLLRGKANA